MVIELLNWAVHHWMASIIIGCFAIEFMGALAKIIHGERR
jgi:hypothetical protein